jgi:hypothetical protein
MAQSGHNEMSAWLSAFGAKADIGRNRCLVWSDAIDPKRTSASRHTFALSRPNHVSQKHAEATKQQDTACR